MQHVRILPPSRCILLIPTVGYVNMKPPQTERVVADCDEALKLDKGYLKALNRRATALETLHRYEESLRGMSFVGCSSDFIHHPPDRFHRRNHSGEIHEWYDVGFSGARVEEARHPKSGRDSCGTSC